MSHGHAISAETNRNVVWIIGAIAVTYAVACTFGWPQHGTELVKAAAHHGDHDEHHAQEEDSKDPTEGQAAESELARPHGPAEQPAAPVAPRPGDEQEHVDHDASSTSAENGHASAATVKYPSFVMVTPFAALLLCIAVLPLLPQTEHWWESNLHRFYVAAGLGVLTLGYYLLVHGSAIEAHWPVHDLVQPTAGALLQWKLAWTVLANAILHEYIPFIVLLFSLYTISGGIRIEGDLAAHPLTNSAFMAVGGLLASFIGTTGAAMLLIRPLLETNRERKFKVHTVVFFIFIVCNCGGCLLPIGDPPLFLGYLRGVDFLWTLNLWRQWLFVNAALLVVYWIWDHFFCYPHERLRDLEKDEKQITRLQITGWQINVPLLIGVVLGVALLDPSKIFPGTQWQAPLYLREVVQLSLVGLSLWFGDVAVRQKNHFNYHAILEVAALFFGIFICMQPALQILGVKGPNMGVDTPMQFFWITGGLSSVLDNAPTYVVFFETAKTLNPPGEVYPATVVRESLLVGISLGAVFLGAMTYIGNGPNFMVKAIAETSGIMMPSFFGYLKYSCFILLPIFLIATLLFF